MKSHVHVGKRFHLVQLSRTHSINAQYTVGGQEVLDERCSGGSSKRALEKNERRTGRVLDSHGRRDKKTRFASD